MQLNGKVIDLPQLEAELLDADVAIHGLGTDGDDLHTYDEDGASIDLPPEAAAVVAAHVPADPPPSDAAMIGEMIGSIEFSGDEASEELAAVMTALTSVLQAKGF